MNIFGFFSELKLIEISWPNWVCNIYRRKGTYIVIFMTQPCTPRVICVWVKNCKNWRNFSKSSFSINRYSADKLSTWLRWARKSSVKSQNFQLEGQGVIHVVVRFRGSRGHIVNMHYFQKAIYAVHSHTVNIIFRKKCFCFFIKINTVSNSLQIIYFRQTY